MKCINPLHFFQFILLLFFAQNLFATQNSLEIKTPSYLLDTNAKPENLGNYTQYIEDIEGDINFKDIQKLHTTSPQNNQTPSTQNTALWQSAPESGIAKGFTHSVYWLRFSINNPTLQNIQWNLEIGYPLLDSIELYVPQANKQYSKQLAGDKLPFNSRPINYRNFVFPITTIADSSSLYYLRIKTTSSMDVPLIIWPNTSFLNEVDYIKMFLGMLYGIVLLALLISLVNAIFLNDTMYVWLSAAFIGLLLFLGGLKGVTYQYLWPESIWWQNVQTPFFMNISYALVMQYCRMFTGLKSMSPKMDHAFIALSIFNCILALLSLVVNYEFIIRFSSASTTIMGVLCLAIGVMAWYRGNRSARLYVFSWIALLLSAITFLLTAIGTLPRTFLTEWCQEFGFGAMVILMIIAQFDRFFQMQRQHEKEQASALNALSHAEKKYRSLFENAIEGIFQMNDQGSLTNANTAFTEIIGVKDFNTLNAVESIPYSMNILSTPEAKKIQTLLNTQGNVTDYVANFHNEEGKKIWVSISIQKNINKTDHSFSYEGSLADITETKKREQAEKQRRMAEASTEAKSTFLTNMSNEIRTPMNTIIGFTDMAIQKNISHELEDFLQKIKLASINLLGIINDILDFSKIEAGKLQIESEPFSLHQLMESLDYIVTGNIKSKDITFSIHIDNDIPDALIGDALRIKQILVNLSNNAVKFTDKGEVTVELELIELDKQCGSIEIGVRIIDTGIGISEEKQKSLFSSFEQTNEDNAYLGDGTGLGLSISKQLVERMGGQIKVSSTENKGTCFTFNIICRIKSRRRLSSLIAHNTPDQVTTSDVKQHPAIITSTSTNPGNIDDSSDKSTNKLPSIDLKEGLARCQGNQGLYFRLFRDFIQNYAHSAEEMKSLLAQEDEASFARLAHTFKGLAGNLGIKQLSNIAMELEKIADISREDLDKALMHFEQELVTVVAEMEKELSDAPIEDAHSIETEDKYQMDELEEKLDFLSAMITEQKMEAYEQALVLAARWPVSEHSNQLDNIVSSLDLFEFEDAAICIQEIRHSL